MTTKDFQTIIQKEATKTDYERYLKQLVYKKEYLLMKKLLYLK